MHDLQLWLTLYAPHVSPGSRGVALALIAAVTVLLAVAVIAEEQRPSRRVARARHVETIPTWGDMYLDSLAETYRPHHRFPRGRSSAL